MRLARRTGVKRKLLCKLASQTVDIRTSSCNCLSFLDGASSVLICIAKQLLDGSSKPELSLTRWEVCAREVGVSTFIEELVELSGITVQSTLS